MECTSTSNDGDHLRLSADGIADGLVLSGDLVVLCRCHAKPAEIHAMVGSFHRLLFLGHGIKRGDDHRTPADLVV